MTPVTSLMVYLAAKLWILADGKCSDLRVSTAEPKVSWKYAAGSQVNILPPKLFIPVCEAFAELFGLRRLRALRNLLELVRIIHQQGLAKHDQLLREGDAVDFLWSPFSLAVIRNFKPKWFMDHKVTELPVCLVLVIELDHFMVLVLHEGLPEA